MDVIQNQIPSPAVMGEDKKGDKDYSQTTEVDYDEVHPVISYKPEHLGAEMDYLYRAAILFLPQCEIFYCHRERHKGDLGMPGTQMAHNMSWLCLWREVSSPQTKGEVPYTLAWTVLSGTSFPSARGKGLVWFSSQWALVLP